MSIVKIARRSYKPGDIVPSRRKLSNYSENKRSHCTVMFSEGTKGWCAYIENFTGSGKNQSDKLSSTVSFLFIRLFWWLFSFWSFVGSRCLYESYFLYWNKARLYSIW